MEPVEIDILLKQNVDTESDKAVAGINRMSQSSEEARKQLSETIDLQRNAIAKLKAELEPLEAAFKKVNIGTNDPQVFAERQRLLKVVRELRTELNDEEQALIGLEKAYDATENKQTTLLTQMRNVKNEMAELKLSGEQETEMYRQKQEELGVLATAYRELTEEQKLLSRGGAQMQGFLSGLSALTGLLSAGGGALGLFNQNSEEFAKIQTRVQSLMAITIGLQQVQNTLHQTSAFRIHTVTKAKQAWAATNIKLATTLGISTVAAQALMATLTLGLSAAITAVIAISSKLIEKQRAIREEQQKLADSIAGTSSSQIASYEAVRVSYNKLGDDMQAKKKFIEDNQDEFKKLGIAVDNVNDADNVFIDNTDAFKNAIMERARATAAMEVAAEKYKEIISKQAYIDNYELKAFSMSAKVTNEDGTTSFVPRAILKAQKEIDKLEKDANNLIGTSVDATIKSNKILADAGIKQVDNTIKNTKKIIDKQANELQKAGERLIKLSADIEKETNSAVIAAMQEGLSKRLAQIDNEYSERKNLIAQRLAEIVELESTHGIDASKQKQQLQELADVEKQRYEQMTAAANAGAQSALDSVWAEINSRFNTESQNRLAEINNFYSQQIAKALENGATQLEIEQMNADHKKDIELEKQHIALETLDFETDIEMKRAQIKDRGVMLASAREEKLLKISIDAAQKRLAKLKEIEANGGDVAKEIKATTVEIEAMNAALAKTPAKKLEEMASYMQDVLNGIGDFASVFDADLGGLFDIASGAVGGISGVAGGIMSGNPKAIIDGAMQLLDSVGKVINANKQANEEIRKFNLSLAQQAIEYSLAVIRAIKDIKSETDSIFTNSFTNTLTQGMNSYNAAVAKQSELMRELGDATVKTGVKKKKFLGITYGTKDVYGNLLKQYPELIKKDGELNRELAETLKASGNLSEETATLIDNILSASDAAKEAMQAVEAELQNLAGSMGQELKKALDDAFASGTDSARDMTKSVVAMLKDISTQQLFNAVFGGLFADLEKRMKDSYAAGGDRDITDDIGWFMDNYPALVEEYNKGLEEFQKAIKDRYGEDAFETDSGRKAVSKAISGVSQDSFDDFSGRLTFLVMKVTDIVAINTESHETGREQLFVMRAMLSQLDTIAKNSDFLRKLTGIEEDISRMVRDGIIIKR